MVAVPAAVLLLDHVATLDQARDDAERAAFRDIQAGRDVTQAHPWVMSHARENRAWLVRKVQLGTIEGYQILEIIC
jgi:hypothetical protein